MSGFRRRVRRLAALEHAAAIRSVAVPRPGHRRGPGLCYSHGGHTDCFERSRIGLFFCRVGALARLMPGKADRVGRAHPGGATPVTTGSRKAGSGTMHEPPGKIATLSLGCGLVILIATAVLAQRIISGLAGSTVTPPTPQWPLFAIV